MINVQNSNSSRHIPLGLDGVEIIANGSGSYMELRKAYVTVDLVKSATFKSGGAYLFSNLRGCDGQRIYFNGCSCVAVNGEIVSRGMQFALHDVVSILLHYKILLKYGRAFLYLLAIFDNSVHKIEPNLVDIDVIKSHRYDWIKSHCVAIYEVGVNFNLNFTGSSNSNDRPRRYSFLSHTDPISISSSGLQPAVPSHHSRLRTI